MSLTSLIPKNVALVAVFLPECSNLRYNLNITVINGLRHL